MKVWRGYSSEHSANLVMVGHFRSIADAADAKRVIVELTEQVQSDLDAGSIQLDGDTRAFSEGMLDLLERLSVHSIAPAEMEQFAYDVNVTHEAETVTVTTDEIDVSAFLKVMIDRSARVEVYSAHDAGDRQTPPS
jgi:hypothetical protein